MTRDERLAWLHQQYQSELNEFLAQLKVQSSYISEAIAHIEKHRRHSMNGLTTGKLLPTQYNKLDKLQYAIACMDEACDPISNPR